MKKAIILVGVPGSGKSTYAKTLNMPHFSSDMIRLELFGTLRTHHTEKDDQTVFNLLHDRVFSFGESLIYDATNITRTLREKLYKKFKSLGYDVELHFVLEPLLFAKYQNEKRAFEKVVPFKIINQMYKFMAAPRIGVDCDDVKIISQSTFLNDNTNYNDFVKLAKTEGIKSAVTKYVSAAYLPEFKNLGENHDTPYHLEDIDEHINMCINNSLDDLMLIVSILHDLGKSQAKENGHYKGHDMISSMYALRFFDEVKNIPKHIKKWDVIEIIFHHMNAHKGLSKKVIEDNDLEPYLVDLIYKFNAIDEVSRITNIPRDKKIYK
ncbi:AAA family ATPase [Acholeplasma granularum]|uniref:AAA family ATPase n=1 Tax=Acholeplasma granularum TaxID=264635 RepID=UPI00046EB2CE|nr:AAA family ATPase [Acholeplasma granularum]